MSHYLTFLAGAATGVVAVISAVFLALLHVGATDDPWEEIDHGTLYGFPPADGAKR